MNEDLDKIQIPLASLRQEIVELMRKGDTHISLGAYLTLLHVVYHEADEDNTAS